MSGRVGLVAGPRNHLTITAQVNCGVVRENRKRLFFIARRQETSVIKRWELFARQLMLYNELDPWERTQCVWGQRCWGALLPIAFQMVEAVVSHIRVVGSPVITLVKGCWAYVKLAFGVVLTLQGKAMRGSAHETTWDYGRWFLLKWCEDLPVPTSVDGTLVSIYLRTGATN